MSASSFRWFKKSVFAFGAVALACFLPAGEPVRLTLNENPFGPSPKVGPALQADLQNLYRYTDSTATALIAQIAAKEGVAPEQIVLGELLEPLGLALSQQSGPGGEFIYSVPGYPALVDAAARVGGVVVAVPLNTQLENDLAVIAAKVNSKTRAVFLVNPHNPSGTVNDARAFSEFLKKVSKQALVIVDEAYLEFSDDYAGRTAVTLTQVGENVLVYRTFAKAYGLAALPLGYAVAPKAVADLLRKQGLGGVRDVNRLAATAASATLADNDYLPRVHAAVTGERAKWRAVLDTLGLRHTPSQANFVYFESPKPHGEVVEALRKEGVLVGRAFAPYHNWVRITIGLPEENAQAQAALRKVFQK
ncbi:pyridoxal phosphate-dependent aminotransferase [Oleiharenicola lentus]|uniref:pyridoxal phosphate-dependent aminotransferase n=1 Tax=Oleiharenicola lentus TaxID=2508720 RepID=UPI003F66234D